MVELNMSTRIERKKERRRERAATRRHVLCEMTILLLLCLEYAVTVYCTITEFFCSRQALCSYSTFFCFESVRQSKRILLFLRIYIYFNNRNLLSITICILHPQTNTIKQFFFYTTKHKHSKF